MKEYTVEELWEMLTEYVGVSEQTLQVATSLNGYTTETMEEVLYILTGYRSFEQLDED